MRHHHADGPGGRRPARAHDRPRRRAGRRRTARLVAGAALFDIALYFPRQPEAAERLLKLEVARAFGLPEHLAGSRGHADTAATADAVFTLRQNGTTVGTITFATGSRDAAFALAGGLALVPGDRLEIEATATPDTTLADLARTLLGYRS